MRPLSEVGGKRLFVKELEDALLSGGVDLAVHSSKDLPADLPDGLAIAAVLPREDPVDVLILPPTAGPARRASTPWSPAWARRRGSAPGSVRRIAQLRGLLPERPVSGRFAAISTRGFASWTTGITMHWCSRPPGCAGSGSRRASRRSLPVATCVPAPGQGIVAIEIRAG